MDEEAKNHLHDQLVKLGDMMGDGLHHEPDGKWISKEYRRVCKALGYLPKEKRNTAEIDKRMKERVLSVKCKCGGEIKQTRSGSMRGCCMDCDTKYQLLKASNKRGQ